MRKKDTDRAPVLISTANWMNFGEGEDGGKIVSHPGEFWMRSSFSVHEPWQKVCILKGRRKKSPLKDLNVPENDTIPSGNGKPLILQWRCWCELGSQVNVNLVEVAGEKHEAEKWFN